MDAVTLLIEDHRAVEELFSTYEATQDAAERSQILGRIIKELSVHAAIEERELYPVMREVMDPEDVDHAVHEHAEAKAMLAALRQLAPDDERAEALAVQMISSVRHHVEEEEGELFPQLQSAVGDERLEELGGALEAAKAEAPTEPASRELLDLTRDDLYEIAQMAEVEGRSDMTKEQLAEALAGS